VYEARVCRKIEEEASDECSGQGVGKVTPVEVSGRFVRASKKGIRYEKKKGRQEKSRRSGVRFGGYIVTIESSKSSSRKKFSEHRLFSWGGEA